MSTQLLKPDHGAFDDAKHEAVKYMKNKEVFILVSLKDIRRAMITYEKMDHWKYIEDEFFKKHAVRVLDRERLVLYQTVDDETMKISGHIGYSLSDRAV